MLFPTVSRRVPERQDACRALPAQTGGTGFKLTGDPVITVVEGINLPAQGVFAGAIGDQARRLLVEDVLGGLGPVDRGLVAVLGVRLVKADAGSGERGEAPDGLVIVARAHRPVPDHEVAGVAHLPLQARADEVVKLTVPGAVAVLQ